ncbi:winged helix-turn-helix domain-containing protein [Aliikangiella coralliicola]|uniref:Tetratricopeptide repeat protein n=1 Tax=Aliikangiella coralliicola TaxID=2592383 RepID=A0A545UER0_9GAMM|nr:winged helix-turn-helix domain-containing protein [Aliikangiella coralliicola]TQV87925.1 tetratricopeptide repeat protein [Aliikangiella coralliicola]
MSAQSTFKLGKWTVEPALNRISRNELADSGCGNDKSNADEIKADRQEVVLVPKVMTLLVCLAEKAGEPVSQELLFEKIWPGQVVSDSSLYQAVAQLRKALGDTGKQKQFIERVSGKGYRLIVPVELPSPTATTPDAQPKVTNENKAKVTGRYRWLGVLLPAILLVGLLFLYELGPDDATIEQQTPTADLKINKISSVAFVKLRFEQHSQSDRLSALNDVLLTQLMHIGGLKIINLQSENDVVESQTILRGRISQQAGKVRVFLQLENVNNKEVVWAKVFEGSERDLFGLQDLIVEDLLALFQKQQSVNTFSESAVEKRVFDQYLLARHLWEQRTVNSLEQAKSILEQLQLEEKLFPLASVALCETYHFLYIYSDLNLSQALRKCKPLLDSALSKQPDLGQAIAAKAFLLNSEGQREEAEKLFDRAVQLSPNYPFVYMWYGNLIRDMGQYDKALEMTKQAYELSPMSPIINRSLAYSFLNLRKVSQAEYYYQRALTLEPDYHNRPVEQLDFFPLTTSRAKAFLNWADENPLMLERQPNYRLTQAQVLLSLGKHDRVSQIVEEFEGKNLNPSFTLYVKATLKVALGEFDAAAKVFNQRRQLHHDNNKFDMPYAQSLFFSGQYEEAERLFLRAVPEFKLEKVEITKNNFYLGIFYVQLLRAKSSDKNWQGIASQIDSQLANLEYPQDLYVADWLVFRGQTEKVKDMLRGLMADGWLPDSNAEPFAYYSMRQLFIQSGLGGDEYERMLAENIRQTLEK